MRYGIIIHGGGGALNLSKNRLEKINDNFVKYLEIAVDCLMNGETATNVVKKCCILLEDDELLNAGRGSVLTENGSIEMDAAIMCGVDGSCGSVAGVTNVKNPILLADSIRKNTDHIMITGDGIRRYIKSKNIETINQESLITDYRKLQLNAVKKVGANKVILDNDGILSDKKFGTIGVVVYDTYGNISVGTSTGGLVNKMMGRVGDSPIIGAGTYVKNTIGGVSCTGYGEAFIRASLASRLLCMKEYSDIRYEQVCDQIIDQLANEFGGLGGFITIGANGVVASRCTVPGMIMGYATSKKDPICSFEKDITDHF